MFIKRSIFCTLAMICICLPMQLSAEGESACTNKTPEKCSDAQICGITNIEEASSELFIEASARGLDCAERLKKLNDTKKEDKLFKVIEPMFSDLLEREKLQITREQALMIFKAISFAKLASGEVGGVEKTLTDFQLQEYNDLKRNRDYFMRKFKLADEQMRLAQKAHFDINEELSQTKKRLDELKLSLSEKQGQISIQSDSLSSEKQTVLKLKKELENVRSEFSTLENQVSRLIEENKYLEQLKDNQNENKNSEKQTILDLSQELENLKEEFLLLENQLISLTDINENLEKLTNTQNAKVLKLTAELRQEKQRRMKAQNDFKKFNGTYSTGVQPLELVCENSGALQTNFSQIGFDNYPAATDTQSSLFVINKDKLTRYYPANSDAAPRTKTEYTIIRTDFHNMSGSQEFIEGFSATPRYFELINLHRNSSKKWTIQTSVAGNNEDKLFKRIYWYNCITLSDKY